MRILVIGSGAREDALSWQLAQSSSCEAIFATPGNAGTATRGDNWEIAPTYGRAIVAKCRAERVDFVVIGPETAIASGVGDRLREEGLAVFGPGRTSGRLESSKVFAKRFMQRHGVPTARGVVVHSVDSAKKALADWKGGVAVKADGLASGKGVVVTQTTAEALAVLQRWYADGVPGGGSEVLLEQRLSGREVSVFALSDGRAMAPFAAACDYKRAGDGDTGPNTGGMGAYSPPSGFPDDLYDRVRESILAPVLRGLQAEGESYVGILYCGLMWTVDGPKVIEFNVRFGDPETQVLMPRVHGDFAGLLRSTADGAMDLSLMTLSEQSCAGIVLATTDYPNSSTPLHDLPVELPLADGCHAFWGASFSSGERVNSSGGRVLTVTALGDDLAAARTRAYEAVRALADRLPSGALTYRTDIALVS